MNAAATTAMLCVAAFAACCTAAAEAPTGGGDAPAQHESNASGWTEVAPPEARCANGAPWRFWYHAGAADKLAVWFEGADACWNAALCDRVLRTGSAAPVAPAPPAPNGIFDPSRADNPLRDFSIAVLPSCTGDAHIGRRTAEYRRADGTP